MWVAHSELPLGPDELRQALGVEIGSKDMNNDNAPSIRTILNCALGLVIVDSSSSKVRLVHFALQEHILANPTLFDSPHSMIAEVCLTYLNFSCIKDLLPALSPLPSTTPFLQYASCSWGTHARREISPSVISLAVKLLDRFETHISCRLLLRGKFEEIIEGSIDEAVGFTGLHGAALLGILQIMVPLLKIKKWDLNAADLFGNTVLVLAAGKGHDEIVKLLLEQEGINPNMADGRGKTPLSSAAAGGHERIARMLLERSDVNPDAADGSGRTPLSRAAECECAGIVRMLLERNDVNPDAADRNGRTPFSWAAGNGRTGILRMLLERNDVNPDAVDKSGRTPLSWAAGNFCPEIVKLLLGRTEVNPDRADDSGRTPLSWAAKSGYVGIVGLLLRGNVDHNSSGKSGQTAFSLAECRNAQMLLEQNDVNSNSSDVGGRTAISWATEGYEASVELLSGRNDSFDSGRKLGQNLVAGRYSCSVEDCPKKDQPMPRWRFE